MTLGGRKIVRLPLGYSDNGVLQDEAEIRAMTGVEEDVLSDDKLPMARRLNEVISNCLERIGSISDKVQIRKVVTKLSTEDQTSLLIALRAISVGNDYTYAIECPSCESVVQLPLNLDSFENRPAKAKTQAVFEIDLPSGRKAKVRPMIVEDTLRTENMRLEGESRISVSIWVRLVELDGKPAPTVDDVKGLLYADRVYLREFFDSMEGGIDTELKVKCQQCNRIFTSHLDIARVEFFSPKMIQSGT